MMALHDVLTTLADGQLHSGQELADRLGVSRTAVWKQLQKLDEYGLSVEAVKGRGYRLRCPLDLLSLEGVRRGLKADLVDSLNLTLVDVIDSTNLALMQRGREGSIHGQVIMAEMQRHGRGRRGRAWASPFGRHLYLSMGWQFHSGAQALEGLSLAIGVAIQEVLQSFGAEGIGLKWPNDIYAHGAKLAGILIEVVGDLSGECQVVVGCGLNINFLPEEREYLDQHATCLNDIVSSLPQRDMVAAGLITRLADVLSRYESEGFASWRDRWNKAHLFSGQPGWVLRGMAQESVVFGDAGPDGALLVEHEDGRQEWLHGGEVSVRLEV
ncbi:biotin--[acetyl-CoA-carboxylase] ligase [Terasakiispira papahanaumokuakeensis]|nr:biotin--[acetyl-CoA-carboxylase] ligase [Terasakiispira papahanaumokuakeensis]